MKAKIKPLIILIAIFAASLIMGVAAGCSIGEATPHDTANNRGMYSSVTYYANGGKFTGSDICYKTMYFLPDTPIFNIGYDAHPVGGSGSDLAVTRTNMVLVGWIKAELDQNGNPTLLEMTETGELTGKTLPMLENGSASMTSSGDEDGRQLSEQKKSFTAKTPENPDDYEYVFGTENELHPKLAKDEHLYLVAVWAPDVVLDYVLVSDDAVTFNLPKVDDPETEEDESLQYEDVELQPGSIIKSDAFRASGYVTLKPASAPATLRSNHSFIYLFWDEECTLPVTSKNAHMGSQQYGPLVVERPQNGENAKIYAKYMSGRWSTVDEPGDVSTMFSQLGANNYYLVDDIDCSSRTLSSLSAGTFTGKILGNGYTISNLNFGTERSNIAPGNGTTVSMFGSIGETAEISDLTIKNVTAYVKVNNSLSGSYTVSIYALFSDLADGATITNLSVEGYKLNISLTNETSEISNIPMDGDTYNTTNWIYGGFGSDELFTSTEYGTIVKDAALTIDNITIIGQEESNE